MSINGVDQSAIYGCYIITEIEHLVHQRRTFLTLNVNAMTKFFSIGITSYRWFHKRTKHIKFDCYFICHHLHQGTCIPFH